MEVLSEEDVLAASDEGKAHDEGDERKEGKESEEDDKSDTDTEVDEEAEVDKDKESDPSVEGEEHEEGEEGRQGKEAKAGDEGGDEGEEADKESAHDKFELVLKTSADGHSPPERGSTLSATTSPPSSVSGVKQEGLPARVTFAARRVSESRLPSTVLLRYGPYDVCGIVTHRENRIEGMKSVLRRGGHAVITEQVDEWNVVELWVIGERVFKCDIRELDFGGDGLLDKLCSEALYRVQKAY